MRVCVYGASSNEVDKRFVTAVEELGEQMGRRGMELVFGGGATGLMGAAARGVTNGGGRVIGVAPNFFNVDGILYEHCDEFIRTDTMRERKQRMEELADAFIVTAGGIGTFDEFFEILTLKELGQHIKPIVIFNTLDYYSSMLAMLDVAVERKFIIPDVKKLFLVTDDAKRALDHIETSVLRGDSPHFFKNVAQQ